MQKEVITRVGAYFRAGAALALIGLIPLTSPAGVGLAQSGYKADEFSISRRDNEQIRPRISDSFVVWQDYRNLPGAPVDPAVPNADIYGRDIDNNSDFKVTDQHTAAHPAISGSRVVYADSRNKDKACDGAEKCKVDIRGYDIDASEAFDVVEHTGDQDFPAIDGDLVVWQDNRDGNWDIRGINTDDDDPFIVIRRDGDQIKPQISGRRVVWEDQRKGPGEPDIFLKDLDSDDMTRVTDSGNARDPDISADYIVYRAGDPASDNQRIRLYKIASKDDKSITDRVKVTSPPRIHGRLVVWTDRRNEEDDNVWAYDIDNDVEFKVAGAEKNQLQADVFEQTVVWQDGRGDSPNDVRGARLTLGSGGGPTATPSAAPAGPPVGSGPCQYILGFKALHDQIPDIVGPCVTNEYWNEIGDSNQITQGGLMAWRKADNWTAFTNGSLTWLNGPCGLQVRPNAGPFFSWEGRVGGTC